MPTPGRRLIVAFVAGIVTSAFLFAFPLWTIRERVMDLQEEDARREIGLREAAGDRLVEAANLTARWSPGAEADTLERARLELSAGRALVGTTEPANGTLEPALNATDRLLSRLDEATRCRLLDQDNDVSPALDQVARSLRGVGRAVHAGAEVGPARLDGSVRTTEDALAHEVGDRRVENATLSIANDTAHVTVTLDRPLPVPGCRGRLSVEACLVGDDAEPLCRSTQARGTPLEVVDERTVRAPSPAPTNETREVRVVVRDVQLGEAIEVGCAMDARDGAWCGPGS